MSCASLGAMSPISCWAREGCALSPAAPLVGAGDASRAPTGAPYCASLTFSIQSVFLPLRVSTMAMCVIALVGPAPCQCFTFGGIRTTSPARISSTGPLQRWTRPTPSVTIRTCPRACVCHAVRAPASKDTDAPYARVVAVVSNSGCTRTVPVKFSAGATRDGRAVARVMTSPAASCASAGAEQTSDERDECDGDVLHGGNLGIEPNEWSRQVKRRMTIARAW